MRPSYLIPILALALGGCAHVGWPGGRPMLCGQSWSPDEEHTAHFGWNGGGTVEAVACSTRCETVLSLPAASFLAYRWTGPDDLEIVDGRRAGRVFLTQVGDLRVHAAPYVRAERDAYRNVSLDAASCSAVEGVIIED